MERWIGKIGVVTGASAGIGLATAKSLVKEGMIVVGLARRKHLMEEEMKNVAGKGQFHAIECDISIEQNVLDAFQWIKANFGTPHVLVNNAGIAVIGKIEETKRNVWEKVFGVNVMGLLQCTQQASQLMRASGVYGHIVNINSTAGHRVLTLDKLYFNVYPGTKHAVTALTETLQNEADDDKIKFTSISPGYVETEILLKGDSTKNLDTSKWDGLKCEDVADAIVYVIGTPPHVQITELTLRRTGEKYNIKNALNGQFVSG